MRFAIHLYLCIHARNGKKKVVRKWFLDLALSRHWRRGLEENMVIHEQSVDTVV